MQQHPPGAGAAGQHVGELVVRHRADETYRRFENAVVAIDELRRRQRRAGVVVEPEELDDVLSTCAKTYLSPRETTGTERAPKAPQFGEAGLRLSMTFIDWNSISRTERYSLTLRQLVQ